MDFRQYRRLWARVGVNPEGTLFNAKIWFSIFVLTALVGVQAYWGVTEWRFHPLQILGTLGMWLIAYESIFGLVMDPLLWIGPVKRWASQFGNAGQFLLALLLVGLLVPLWYLIMAVVLWLDPFPPPKL